MSKYIFTLIVASLSFAVNLNAQTSKSKKENLKSPLSVQLNEPDWKAIEGETMQYFQSLVQINTSNPPGNETLVVDYLKKILEKENIEVKTFALDPMHSNLVARIKGNGKKRPLLLMGHTDVVTVDSSKWIYPPFSAARKDGYVYGRGTLDDKPHVVAGLMTLLILKRMDVKLDRDIIFLAESGEEGTTRTGIEYIVNEYWPEIDAEYCFAEGGAIVRKDGKVQFGSVATTEKVPIHVKLVSTGISGHGSVPLRSNAIVHLSNAVAKVAGWQTPMRLNETTTAFFKRLADLSNPDDAARYRALISEASTDSVQEYLAVNNPRYYSILRTSISPNIIKGGYRFNVIPSEAEATLDVRALPDEDIPKFLETMKQIVNDPQIEIVKTDTGTVRPSSKPSDLNTEAFKSIETALKKHYNTVALPTMITAGTDMAFLRARGVQCYGIGPLVDSEDGPKGFGGHSDQERILEESLHQFIRFQWEVIKELAFQSKK